MADSDVNVRVRLKGGRKAAAEARGVGKAVGGIGDKSGYAARQGGKLDKSSRRGRRSLMALGGAAKLGGLALGAGLFVGAKKAIGAFEESRQVVAQTGAVLKSTGGTANVTARDVDVLTAALMRKTAIDDEQIRQGANMLLTFTRIRNEAGKGNKIFDQTTVAATDMAAAMGSDTKGAALMLGKALNDPAKGLSRLMRVGVTFTQGQQDQIKKLQESGDMLGAQKVILAEVTKEFGGSAAAQRTPLKALATTMGELSETAGAALAPAVDKAAKKANVFVNEMMTGTGQGGRFVDTLRRMWTEAKPIVAWLGRAAVNTGRFVGKHPELAKVAVVLGTVGLAVKAISFAKSVTGVGRLLGGLKRLGKTKAGQRAIEAITTQMGTLPARSRTALGKSRKTFQSTMGSVGRTGGVAASNGIITTTGTRVKTASSKGGRLAKSFGTAGRMLGPIMAAALVVELVPGISRALQERFPGLSQYSGSGGWGELGSDLFKGNELPGVNLFGEGNAKGGPLIPRGDEGLVGARRGEFMMRESAVQRWGLGAMRALNAGMAPAAALAGGGGGAVPVIENHLTLRIGRRDVAVAVDDHSTRRKSEE